MKISHRLFKFYSNILLSMALSAVSISSFATTFAVNTTDDINNGACTTTHCSLREAIIASNNTSGQNTITFDQINRGNPANTCTVAISDSDKICKITVQSVLPAITSSVIIDGSIPESRSSIPGSVKSPQVFATERPGIEISGELLPVSNSVIRAGLFINGASDSLIKGLVINRFPGPSVMVMNSSNDKVISNYLGTDVTGKLVSTISGASCTANCYGNRGPLGDGVFVGGSTNVQVGGKNNNERNLVSNNLNTGITLSDTSQCSVIGNFIGSDIYGITPMGNRNESLEIRGFTPDTRPLIGLIPTSAQGSVATDNRLDSNLIMNSKARANLRLLGREFLYKTSSGDPGTVTTVSINNTVIVNNMIGINLAGQRIASAQGAISISDAVNGAQIGFEMIEGKITPEPNIFADNAFVGVGLNTSSRSIYVLSTASGNTGVPVNPVNVAVLYNKIYGYSNLGIDLAVANLFTGDGVTANDPMDVDMGPNHYQNFPVLDATRSFMNPALVQVWGNLNSEPNHDYLVQFFSNNSARCFAVTGLANIAPSVGCSNSNFPYLVSQGMVFIGEEIVHTDSNGNASFHIPAKSNPAVGTIISATATRMDMVNNVLTPVETSEFSQAIDVISKGGARAYENASLKAGTNAPQDDDFSDSSIN